MWEISSLLCLFSQTLLFPVHRQLWGPLNQGTDHLELSLSA